MIEFLKRVGYGLLFIVVSPFALAALALFSVAAVFVFVFMLLKALFLFFTGRSVFDDLPEDIEAKTRLGLIAKPVVAEAIPPQTPASAPSAAPEETPEKGGEAS